MGCTTRHFRQAWTSSCTAKRACHKTSKDLQYVPKTSISHTHLPIKPVSGVTARLNFKTFQMILVGKGWTRHSLLAVCCKTILSGMDIQMHNKGNMTQYQRGWAGSGGITIATCSQIPHTHTPSFIRREREIDLQSGERQGQSFTFNMFCDMIAC